MNSQADILYFSKPYIIFTSCLSDNGPHYHNSGVLCYLSEVNRAFNVTIKEYNNFEAGEGKSQLDSHFAHISHKIVQWVCLGNALESREQLAELIKVQYVQFMSYSM